jgi:hypothetical protein
VLLACPAADFSTDEQDVTIKKIIAEREKLAFSNWHWTALEMVVKVLGPIRLLIKLLVCQDLFLS